MARKNLIGISDSSMPRHETPALNERPIAGLVPPVRASSPVGGITKTLGSITQKMERAGDLERQLAEGKAVIEIDPALIDASFISDRMEMDSVELAALASQIAEHGQQVPILVRPHVTAKGRYQVAYGHRRLAAVKQLGIKVRAVVRELSDEQLVVSQGQENNARANLSYIERCLFAKRLEERDFSRATIMAALNVDKQALSKMLIIMRQVSLALVQLIGPAPDVGRRRWMELGAQVENADVEALLQALSSADDYQTLPSNDRFQRALDLVTTQKQKPGKTTPHIQTGSLPVTIKKTATRSTFVFDSKAEPGFDDFVQKRLADLYAEFKGKASA
ncbi:plasmid partitioning protein RepB [Allorhizobium terrae]|uniref:Plasmid partitioning protein RepB n=1 Tax=Allorhizobium terrae TaxID=1848972 RepID=A0A4S3ZQE1_9HYPH|nr:plasmid partitioning protein RepB [Allorhizobium terrae]THF47744.1 plasmid partitioning protein RepB [Allorhizobium terrae]